MVPGRSKPARGMILCMRSAFHSLKASGGRSRSLQACQALPRARTTTTVAARMVSSRERPYATDGTEPSTTASSQKEAPWCARGGPTRAAWRRKHILHGGVGDTINQLHPTARHTCIYHCTRPSLGRAPRPGRWPLPYPQGPSLRLHHLSAIDTRLSSGFCVPQVVALSVAADITSGREGG